MGLSQKRNIERSFFFLIFSIFYFWKSLFFIIDYFFCLDNFHHKKFQPCSDGVLWSMRVLICLCNSVCGLCLIVLVGIFIFLVFLIDSLRFMIILLISEHIKKRKLKLKSIRLCNTYYKIRVSKTYQQSMTCPIDWKYTHMCAHTHNLYI